VTPETRAACPEGTIVLVLPTSVPYSSPTEASLRVTEDRDGGDPAVEMGALPPTPRPGPAGRDPVRLEQAELLRTLALRLEGGDPALPTDVFAPLARELERRDDEAAIAAAWDEQGDKEAEPWVYFRGRARG
jgi:hypothetical protein